MQLIYVKQKLMSSFWSLFVESILNHEFMYMWTPQYIDSPYPSIHINVINFVLIS